MELIFIDLAGVEMLVSENKWIMKQGGGLYFVGLKPIVKEFAIKSHFIEKVDEMVSSSLIRHLGAIIEIWKKSSSSEDVDICEELLFYLDQRVVVLPGLASSGVVALRSRNDAEFPGVVDVEDVAFVVFLGAWFAEQGRG